MKKIFKIVFVIIGTLIGAGFASGQEIYVFFYAYGVKGLVGLAVSTLLMSFVIYKVLMIVKTVQVENYKELLDVITKSGKSKIKIIISYIINIFVLITFFIMIAGFGAYFEEQLKINHIIGSSLLALICFFIFQKDIQGVVRVNELIVPFVIVFIILLGSLNIGTAMKNFNSLEIAKIGEFKWLISSILYAGYNSILLIPVLITLRSFLEKDKRKKQVLKISIIMGVITLILGIIIFLTLINAGEKISQIELPIAYVVSKMANPLKVIYGIIIILSIFTTAVSLGNSFLENVEDKIKKDISNNKRFVVSILICIRRCFKF